MAPYRASRPYIATLGREPEPEPDGLYSDIDRHPDNEFPPHVAVFRIESSLYFANADAIRARIQHAAQADSITAVVLDAETTPFIDVTAVRMLADLAKDLRRREVRLLLAHDIGQVRDLLQSVIDEPAITFYLTVQATVPAAERSA